MKNLMFIAGEASGDAHAAAVIRELRGVKIVESLKKDLRTSNRL